MITRRDFMRWDRRRPRDERRIRRVRPRPRRALDLATVWPDGNFHTTNAKKFAEEVGKVTNGEIKIIVQAGGSLGFKGPEQLRAVRDGLVPLADILNIQQVGDEPLLGTGVDPVPGRLGSGAEDPAQVSAARIRGDRGQEQPESPLHGAVADAVSAPEGQDRQSSMGSRT